MSGTGYDASRSRCVRDGATLMVPENFSDLQFIAQEMPFHRTVWLGINDIEEEGNFVREDGLPLTYTNWDPESNDPDNWNGVTLEYELMLSQLWRETSGHSCSIMIVQHIKDTIQFVYIISSLVSIQDYFAKTNYCASIEMLKRFFRIILPLVHNINQAETEEFLIIFNSKHFSQNTCLNHE